MVLRAVEELGYQASSAGRNLRIRKSEMLGLLFYPSCAQIFKNPFYAEIMEGLEEGLTKRVPSAPRGISSFCGGFDHPRLLGSGKVDGMILLGRFPSQIIQNFCRYRRRSCCWIPTWNGRSIA